METFLLHLLILGTVVGLVGGERENIARGKPTTLTSTESNFAPELAIDGDPKTFALSQVQTTPTWRVNLEKEYSVDTVIITSRPDCCTEMLTGARIHIGSLNSGNPRCAEVSEVTAGQTYTYNCNGMKGRYVSIFIIGDRMQLALAEVQVFAQPEVHTSPPPPLQVGGRTVVLVRERLSWYDALLHCRRVYRDLVSLGSPDDQLKVGNALLLREGQTAHVWLGLRREMLSSTWYWMNGKKMSHSSWEGGKPQWYEVPGTSPCGAAANKRKFLWSSRPCEEQLNFLCYTDGDPGYSPVLFFMTFA